MRKRVDKDELGEKLEKLAVTLADEAAKGEEPSKARSDVFGKLTTYFAATRKLNLKAAPDEEDGDTFSSFKDKVNGATAN